MQDFYQNLEIEILDDCGHFLHLEKADEFNNKLLNFFADSKYFSQSINKAPS